MNSTKFKIKFAPGCFDNFEGTQKDLDELIKEIYRMAESGELLENAEEISAIELQNTESSTVRTLQ